MSRKKEAINRLKHMIGIGWYVERKRGAVEGAPSWCLRIGLYWFGIILFRRWHPNSVFNARFVDWTGVVFCYGRNKEAKEGDYIWLNWKTWGRYAT